MAETTNRPAESAAAAASRVAPLDLAALKPQKATRPKRTAGPGRTPRDNTRVEGWVRDLESERKGGDVSPAASSITIPETSLGEMRSRLNHAAAKLGCGMGLALADGRKIPEVIKAPKQNAKVALLYWTKKRKVKSDGASGTKS